MTYKEALSWLEQPGIKAMMPVDPHTQEALRVAKVALVSKCFSKEELELAKKLAYENSAEAEIGFEFKNMWVVNPFMEETGRWEFKDLAAMCKHYGEENVCNFITRILQTK